MTSLKELRRREGRRRPKRKFQHLYHQFARVHDAVRRSKDISRIMSYSPIFRESALANSELSEDREWEIESVAMKRASRLWLLSLKIPEFGLRVYRQELITAKVNFLLCDWNWISATIVKEWQEERASDTDVLRCNLESWTIDHLVQVLGPCAGEEDDYTYDY